MPGGKMIRACDSWQHNVKKISVEHFFACDKESYTGCAQVCGKHALSKSPVHFTFFSLKPSQPISQEFQQRPFKVDPLHPGKTLIWELRGNLLAPQGKASQKAELACVCVCLSVLLSACLCCACLMKFFNELADSRWILLCQGIVSLLRASE